VGDASLTFVVLVLTSAMRTPVLEFGQDEEARVKRGHQRNSALITAQAKLAELPLVQVW